SSAPTGGRSGDRTSRSAPTTTTTDWNLHAPKPGCSTTHRGPSSASASPLRPPTPARTRSRAAPPNRRAPFLYRGPNPPFRASTPHCARHVSTSLVSDTLAPTPPAAAFGTTSAPKALAARPSSHPYGSPPSPPFLRHSPASRCHTNGIRRPSCRSTWSPSPPSRSPPLSTGVHPPEAALPRAT